MNRKLKRFAAIALIFVWSCASNFAMAQAQWGYEALKRYAMYITPGRVPTSHALSYKGQFRVDLGLGWYTRKNLPEPMDVTAQQWVNPIFLQTRLWTATDWNIGLNYSPWDRVALSGAVTLSHRYFESDQLNTYQPRNGINSGYFAWEMGATFHDWIDERFAYEARYTLGFNVFSSFVKSEVVSKRSSIFSDDPTEYFNDDQIHGFALRHGIMGGVSVFNQSRSLQAGLQLHADLVHFLSHDYTPLMLEGREPWKVQQDMYQRFSDRRAHLHFTPSLLFAYHAKYVFSAQFHVGLPIAVQQGKFYAPCPNMGLQLSFRLRKWRRTPTDTSKLVPTVIEKVLQTVEPLVTDILQDEEQPKPNRNDDDDD